MALNHWATFYNDAYNTALFTITEFLADTLKIHEGLNEIGYGSVNITAELADQLDLVVGMTFFMETLERKYFIKNLIYSGDSRVVTIEFEDEAARWSWVDAGNNQYYGSQSPALFMAKMINLADPSAKTIYWDADTHTLEPVTAILEGGSCLDNMRSISKWSRTYFSIVRSYNPRTGAVGLIKIGSFIESLRDSFVYGQAVYGAAVYGSTNQRSVSEYRAANTIYYVNQLNALSSYTYPTVSSSIGALDANNEKGYGITYLITAQALDSVSEGLDSNPQFCFIEDITETSTGTEAFNRLIIEGGGLFPLVNQSGAKVLSQIPGSVGKVIEAPLNLGALFQTGNYYAPNGYWKPKPAYDTTGKYWYIQHPNSTLPQTRTKRVKYQEVVPVSASDADLKSAATTLYSIGTYILNKFKSPIQTYAITTVGRPATLKCGSIVRVQYQGKVTNSYGTVTYKDIDTFYYVTGLDISYDSGNNPHIRLTISNTGEEEISVDTVVVSLAEEIKKLKFTVQPSITYKEWTSPVQVITGTTAPNTGRQFDFTFRTDESIASINEMIANIYVMRLRQVNLTLTDVLNTGDGGGVTNGETNVTDHPATTYDIEFGADFMFDHRHEINSIQVTGVLDQFKVYPITPMERLDGFIPSDGSAAYRPLEFWVGGDNYGLNNDLNKFYGRFVYSTAWIEANINRGGFRVMTSDVLKWPETNSSGAINPKRGQVYGFPPAKGTAKVSISKAQVVGSKAGILTHKLNIPKHTHASVASALSQIIKDDDPANMATGLVCRFNNLAVPLVKDASGSTAYIDVYRPVLSNLVAASFKGKWQKLSIACTNGRAEVFATVEARMTVIPIKA